MLVPVTAILVTHNPRTDLGPLDELRESVAARGILNPLLIRNTAAGTELLGGHRRLQCARDLGLTHVPCRLVETDEPEVIKLLDNNSAETLSPTDVCLGLKRLLPAFAGNKSALARAVSKSPSYVNKAVRAAELIEAGLCARSQSELSLRALFDLASAEDPQAALDAAPEANAEAIRSAKASAAVAQNGKPPRQPSGALPGGRSISQAFQLRERRGGTAFSLRINFDAEKTAPETRADIISKLEAIVERLKGSG
jgi:ParB family chromosome partitioning protein